ncbi:efflux RND transporter periplasmic adaptor subunit [Arthrobacter sp. 3Tela_A]|uniref:efflux RND transporter periplasmic adaptor subunit n=1 Tax=Arthrobacter sp. 3Tela_A TaxID=3093743 RepID=UPI003BB7B865
MGAARRLVFPILWLVVFGVIAAALFKLAFLDGLSTEAETPVPSAALQTATVEATRASVTNLVQAQGSVVADPAAKVRSTSDGTVVYIDVEAGQAVAKGDRLFQVRKPVETPPAALPQQDDDDAPPPAPVQLYAYADIVATASGTLTDFPVLLNQQVTVGTDVASVAPGTFSVQGTLSTEQQFRILDRPQTATVSLNGGPAPFECGSITTGGTADGAAGQEPGSPEGQPAGGATGTFSCAVPAGVSVFAGLGASVDITAGEAENVVTVPATAVRGAVQNGVVWVIQDASGAPEERAVSLGLNDGQQVEITEGLAEGEQVLQFVPGSPAQDDGQFAMTGAMGG